ncbi:VOC family protein, partial [Rhizobium sp. TRM95111]|nr:VOC family protein [Rhizobium alarense]
MPTIDRRSFLGATAGLVAAGAGGAHAETPIMNEAVATASPDHAVNMPAHIDHSRLVVTDLPLVSNWYRTV